MAARAAVAVLVDLRSPAGALDVRHAEHAEQDEPAVADREVVAVERVRRRAGGAVALRVVLAAVARAPEACGLRLVQRDRAAQRADLPRLAERAVRLHRAAEMRTAV